MSFRLNVGLLAMIFLLAASGVMGRRAGVGAVDPAGAEALWIAGTAGIQRIAPADGRLTLSIPESGGTRAVAVDPGRSRVWVWTGHSLVSLGFDGARGLTVPLDLPATVQADLAVRSGDGSVWLAAGRELRSLSAAGALLTFRRLADPVVALALDPEADLLWVATARSVAVYDGVSGAPLRSLDLGKNPDVRGLALSSSGAVWIGLRDGVRRFGADGALLRTVPARNLLALAAVSEGGAWLAEAGTLRRIDAAGSDLFTLEPFGGRRTISALAAHPTEGSVWVAAGSSLAKVDAAGGLALRTDLPGEAQIRDLALFADTSPPLVEILAPGDGALLARQTLEIEVAWQDAGTGADPSSLELRLDGSPLAALCDRRDDGATCAPASPLADGEHILTATVRDAAGNESAASEVRFSIDTVAPVITLTRPAAGTVVDEPELVFEGTLSEPALLKLAGAGIPVAPDGAFVHGPVLLQEGANSFAFTATDRAGNTGTLDVAITYEPPAGGGLPPDPATVAPELDRTIATDLFTAVRFLWTGRRPVQTGVAAGAIERERVAVVRGRVLTRDGAPLDGARISILRHPELGATLSRADGTFDLATQGGGGLTVQIEKEGFLPAQRQVEVQWQSWAVLEDVALVPFDAAVTVVTSGASTLQIARGSRIEDEDGARRSTLLIPAGTQARLVLPDGTGQPLETLTLRATEYTVGPNGPRAMPASLPAASAYTYAVELSADEAVAAGAAEVVFDRPLAHYVENFLGFPVGGAVPAGYYDRTLAAWIPSGNGRVVQVLGSTAGLADLDVDGTGAPAEVSALVALGITDGERQALATLYAPGQSLWRVPVSHFTPWDFNWPFAPPDDAEPPSLQEEPETEEPEEEACEQPGSIIECQNQVLGEELPVAGTPFSLVYRSDRVPGHKTSRSLRIALSGDRVPASLKRIELKVSIAGRSLVLQFPPAPRQIYDFTWNGTDAYGRLLQGRQPVTIEIGWVYPGHYRDPLLGARSFGQPGGGRFTTDNAPARSEVTYRRILESTLGQWSAQPAGFGGWTFSAQHAYDPHGVLQRGDGGRILGLGPLDQILRTVAGSATVAGYGADGPASASPLYYPESVAVDPWGNVYVGERTRIRRIDRATGRITTIAGQTYGGFGGDGGPALQAELNYPRGLVVDGAGTLYFADAYNHRVRKITPAGIISTVAGTGEAGYGGDGFPATGARLDQPMDLALDGQGNLYIADFGNGRIRRVTPTGVIDSLGNGLFGHTSLPGLRFQIETPGGVAVGRDGAVYVSSTNRHVVFRIEPDGDARPVAGNGQVDFSGFTRDGVPATQTFVPYPGDLLTDSAGNLLVTSYGRVRRIGPTGLITTLAGGGRNLGDGIHASGAWPGADGLALDGQGTLYIAAWHRVRKVTPSLPNLSLTEIPIAAPDGTEVWVFDGYGRHLRTLDSLTGSVRLRFHYDDAGRLAQTEDADGLITRIERDAAGQAVAVVAPFGQRTGLTTANGALASVRNPAGETVRLTSTPEGLLTGLTDPRGGVYTFSYDALGRLQRDTDPAGGFKAVTRTAQADAWRVDLTTAEGRISSYTVESLPTGEKRWSNTSPAGLTSETLFRQDGSRRLTFPDGTVVTTTPGPDPRFGLQAPVTQSLQVRTPAGRTWTLSTDRTATYGTPATSLPTTLQETVRINGRAYTSTWNATQRRYTLTTPAGRRRTLDLDAKGRPASLQIGNLAPVAFSYDGAGRLTEAAQGTGLDRRVLTFGYDAAGWLESLTDPLSRNLGFDRDAAGRVLRQTLPDRRAIDFAYDPSGNVTGITPPGRPPHGFDYTPTDLQETYRPPDLGIGRVDTAYHYDRDHRLTRIERPDGKTVLFGYDGAGRLATLDVSRGRIAYAYAPTTGKLASLGSPGGETLTYTYDGSLLTRTTWSGPVAGTVEHTYDNDFQIVTEKVNGEAPIAYQYDADGLLLKAGDLTITRDPQTGLVTATTLGAVTTANGYNAFGELLHQEARTLGQPVFTADYTRDLLGRITRKIETIEGTTDTWDYTYDPAGRLQEVHRNGNRLSHYDYDANGNRLAHITPAETVTATYDDQDRLLTYGGIAYTYTANGELATKTQNGQTVRYEYDEIGNLVKVTMPNGIEIEYVIDGQGRRVGKRVNGVFGQGFLYGGQLTPVAELGDTGQVVARFVYGTRPNVPDYVIKGWVTYRIFSDHLGSPRLVVNAADGTIVQRMVNDELGRVIPGTNSGFQPFGFAGGLHDRHTGLVRFGARDYEAGAGRWVTKDPILFDGGLANLYNYGPGDPINFIDPDGMAVTNNCSCTVYVKPENVEPGKRNAVPLGPGKVYPYRQDGVAVPNRRGEIFKNVDGADVTIEAGGVVNVDTNVDFSAEGLGRFGGQIIKGGWKDLDWLAERHTEFKDFTWDELFNSVPLLPPTTSLPECR
jgi:RHS repeat-associated protein